MTAARQYNLLEVGLDIIELGGRHAYGIVTEDGGTHTALLPAGASRADAQLAAFELLLIDPVLSASLITLACGDAALTDAVTDLGGVFAHVSVYPHSARLASTHPVLAAARDLARTTLDKAGILPSLVTAATDGSYGRYSRRGGFGWITDDGRYGHGPVRASNPLTTELRAIEALLVATSSPAARLRVTVDSKDALALIDRARDRGPHDLDAAPSERTVRLDNAATATLSRIVDALEGRDVTFSWVRGHDGDILNDGADRLAVCARRAGEADLPRATVKEIAAGIAADVAAALTRTTTSTTTSAATSTGTTTGARTGPAVISGRAAGAPPAPVVPLRQWPLVFLTEPVAA